MFQKNELIHLQAKKDMLVLQSSINRLKLAADWQRLRSPEQWLHEAGRVAKRHPMATAGLATAAGVMLVKALRNRGSMLGSLGSLGKVASLAFTVWKLVRKPKAED